MPGIIPTPDATPGPRGRRRVERGIQRRERGDILADAHAGPLLRRAAAELHPLAQPERRAAELRQPAGAVAGAAVARHALAAGALGRGDRGGRPDARAGGDGGGGEGAREQQAREEPRRGGGGDAVHGHGDFALQPRAGVRAGAAGLRQGGGVEAEDGRVQVELDARGEGVDDGVRVPVPVRDGGLAALRHQGVGLDGWETRVVARDEQFARVLVVGEPDLVLGEEPVGVVVYVKGPPGCGWVGAFKDGSGNVGLDEGLPQLVGESVVVQEMAGLRNFDEIQRGEKRENMMNELGREGKERGLVRVHCLDSGELEFGRWSREIVASLRSYLSKTFSQVG